MGVLFGVLGVVLATPMAIVTIVMIQMLYIQDVLNEDVRLMGDHVHE
jgi:predicted PurR-regulated permease PerM